MLYPEVYDEIEHMVAERAPAREEYLAQVIDMINTDLKENNIKGVVTGRPQALLLHLPKDDCARQRV